MEIAIIGTVILARLLVPLLIIKYPLPAIIACLVIDAVDQTVFQAVVPDAIYNGDPTHRLPGNAHLKFPGCQGDSLLMLLDAQGIYCSTGSACSAGVAQPSHVLVAMGADPTSARSSLRFSLGHDSTADDVAALALAIGPVVARARSGSVRAVGAHA